MANFKQIAVRGVEHMCYTPEKQCEIAWASLDAKPGQGIVSFHAEFVCGTVSRYYVKDDMTPEKLIELFYNSYTAPVV